jgi:group II intron reverse transcriptase/maturase
MLAPQPGQTVKFPKPIKIISKGALAREWKNSRDATKSAGRKGVDNVTASQFAANLDHNLDVIARCLKQGKFGFSKLRAVFIPKPNSEKERMICIPTVRDRLVQRVISQYIASRKLFPIYNSSSFGFIKGIGTRDAINAVVRLRGAYDWCLKTDVEAFFDRIPRPYLKERVRKYLGVHSLTPLICNAIDGEAKITNENKSKMLKQGVKLGLGVRQGMPLSPLLANLALAEFDRKIANNKIEMVRYADDLVLFFHTKSDAHSGQALVTELLNELQLTIPKIAENSKTSVVSTSEPLTFLGREIVYLDSARSFVARVSNKQIAKIKARLSNDFSFKERSEKGRTFQETIVDLSKSISAYLGIYKDAYNYKQFEDELRGQSRSVIVRLFEELFGQQALGSLSPAGRKFLGIEILDTVEPNPELDV